MQFRKQRSFGPRISLTNRQVAGIVTRCTEWGLQVDVEQCATGSVYVSIHIPGWDRGLGDWYICRGDVLAKIRLSGHDEGRVQDSTHSAIGSKSECLRSLAAWLDEVIAEHGPAAKQIVAAGPTVEV